MALQSSSDVSPGPSTETNTDSADPGALSKKLDPIQLFATVVALVPAVGYFIGYIAVTSAANRLGLSVDDFNFDFRDFLFLPGIFYGFIALGLIMQLWVKPLAQSSIHQSTDRWKRLSVSIAARIGIVLMAISLATGNVILSNASNVNAIFLAPVFLLLTVIPFWLDRHRPIGLVALASVVFLVGGLTVQSSLTWADSVAAYAKNGRSSPNGLLSPGYVLNPRTGRLCVDGRCRCRVRVSPTVIGSPTGFEVVPQIDSFTPGSCKPQP